MDNPFQRLPDDVLLSIFKKINDFKFVYRCSLVCTRFALVITCMDTVMVSFSRKDWTASNFRRFDDPNSWPKMDTPHFRQMLSFANCLKKFREVKALHIKFSPWSSSLVQWNAKFGAELECVVALIPASIGKIDQEEAPHGQQKPNVPEIAKRLLISYACCQEAVAQQTLLFMLINDHPLLKMVTFEDEKQGMMCMEEKQIIKLREAWMNRNLDQIHEAVKNPHIFKYCYVPEMRLRGSGYVLKGVIMLIFKHLENSKEHFDDDDYNLLGWHYDVKDVFREAVREILTNHKEELYLVPNARDLGT